MKVFVTRGIGNQLIKESDSITIETDSERYVITETKKDGLRILSLKSSMAIRPEVSNAIRIDNGD